MNEKEFKTKFPLPTISASNKKFRPDKYWRGSSWININWFVQKGLENYGINESEFIKKKSLELVKKSGFREYYSSLNGNGYGPKDFSWSGLVFDMD